MNTNRLPSGAAYVTEDEVARLLSMDEAIAAVERAMRALAGGRASNHPRRRHRVPGGIFHEMDAAYPDAGVVGLKTYTTFSRDSNRFHMLVYSSEDGGLLAVLEADQLGRIRTGAASGLATRILARGDSRTAGVIGAGRQAWTQLAALAAVRPIREARVYARARPALDAFCERARAAFGFDVSPASSAREVAGADVVVTATTSREPVLLGEWLRPGTHLNVMGGNHPHRREIDRAALLSAAIVVVDSIEQARIESGEILDAEEAGSFSLASALELGQAVVSPPPRPPEAITLFRSHGLAIWDLAAASVVLEKLGVLRRS